MRAGRSAGLEAADARAPGRRGRLGVLRQRLRPDRPAMDMTMRVTSGDTPFPVVDRAGGARADHGDRGLHGQRRALQRGGHLPARDRPHRRDAGLSGRCRAPRAGAGAPRQRRAVLAGPGGRGRAGDGSGQPGPDGEGARRDRVAGERAMRRASGSTGSARGSSTRAPSRGRSTRAISAAAVASAEAKRRGRAERQELEAADSMLAQSEAALRTATIVRDYVTIVASTSGLRGQAARRARASWSSRAWPSSRSPRSTGCACRPTSARRIWPRSGSARRCR